ncbi:hypothetical protein PO909_032889 [Leuciscus waleckii]
MFPLLPQVFCNSGYFLHCHSSDVSSAPTGFLLLWLFSRLPQQLCLLCSHRFSVTLAIFSTATAVMSPLLPQVFRYFGYFLHCHRTDVSSAPAGVFCYWLFSLLPQQQCLLCSCRNCFSG